MFDRYWRLRVIGAAVSLAGAAAFAAWYVVYVLPIDLRAGKLAFTGIVAAIDVVFVLCGIGAYQLLKAAPQRRRSTLRQEVMNGNRDAMPLARPLPNAPSNADTDHEPFDVNFAPAILQWLRVAFLLAIMAGITWVFIAAATQRVDVHRLSTALMCPHGHEPNCAGGLAAFMLLSLMLLVGYLLICVNVIVEMLRPLSISSVRLRVRTDGIERQTLVGRPVLMRWSDIVLLEARHSIAPSRTSRTGYVRVRNYTCYTRTQQFGWDHEETAPTSNPRARLTSVVMARTGLLAHTFDIDLFEPGANSNYQASRGERASTRFEVILIGVACIIGMMALLPALPPRDQSNVETGLIVATIGLMFYIVMSLRPQKPTAREQGGVALVSAESFDESSLVIHPAATYKMTVGSFPLFKANQVVFGMLGLFITAAGAAILINEFDPALLTNHGAPLVPATPISTAIAIGVMAIGLVTIVVVARARDTIVLADISGVRKRWLLGNVFIPWERVERVEQARYWGYPGYRVVSSQPKTVIGWPIEPFQPSRKPQEPSAILTTPAQMAEVVPQRSGTTIREVRR